MIREIEVEIKPILVESDPEILVYEIVVKKGKSTWHETFGSLELAKAFLKGVEAALSMVGIAVKTPLIPKVPKYKAPIIEKITEE